MKNILLTGATEMVGAHLLALLGKRSEIERIYLLVTRGQDEKTTRTLRRLLNFASPLRAEVRYLYGDMWLPRFGLKEAEWQELARTIDTLFHCGENRSGRLRFLSGSSCRADPLDTCIELLGLNQRLRLGHLSTAFVSGRRRGLFTEFDLECGQRFNSAWEHNNYQTELKLRRSPVSDRVTVFRPSFILGDSRNGTAFALSGFYPVLRRLRRSATQAICGDPLARIDIVPVDYVAAAMIALSSDPGQSGRTFHLVAGWHKSLPLKALIAMIASHGPGKSKELHIVPPVLARALRPIGILARRSHESRIDCLNQPAVFDDFLARAVLEPAGISCPPVESYLDKAIDFAEQCRWIQELAELFASCGMSPAASGDKVQIGAPM